MYDFRKTKAVFIDMDGTIVESHPILKQLYFDFMANVGLQGSSQEFEELMGPSMAEVVAILKKRYNLSLSVRDMLGMNQKKLEDIYANELCLIDGVENFLSYITRKGVKILLVTAATEELAHTFLEAKGIYHYFEAIVTPGNGRGKPAPDIYHKALEAVSCKEGEVVVIEDSPNGVQAAVSAGISTIHIFDIQLPSYLQEHPLVVHANSWEVVKDFFRLEAHEPN